MRFAGIVCAAALLLSTAAAAADQVRGTVYHDRNSNQRLDAGEPGIADVLVSNGREVVKTDRNGRYALPATEDMIVFITKPRDWMTPLTDHNLPRFHYIHKPAGSPRLRYLGVDPTGPLPASVDFPLHEQASADAFRIVVFGDPQPYNHREVDYFAQDIIAPLIGTELTFGISLGDLVGDDLVLFDPLNRATAKLGAPWYNVLGNHDIDFQSPNDEHSDETFERVYGPPYYAFEYGDVHFVVLDDVNWIGATDEQRGYYTWGLGERQLTWLANHLEHVSKDKLLVVCMHIPINSTQLPKERKDLLAERARLYELMAAFPHCISFSAHIHVNEHHFLDADDGWPKDEPHHHINFATTSGSWWRGAPDETGIPHTTMRCGAPNGWSFVNFDGTDYAVEFRAARRPADYQMELHAPNAVARRDLPETELVANVFAGSERSQTEFRVGEGAWRPMKHERREDPHYAEIKRLEESDQPPHGRKLPAIVKSSHIWVAPLPADLPPGTHVLEVRSRDMFGKTHYGRRLIRVAGAAVAETN